jgi:hypothetical protein
MVGDPAGGCDSLFAGIFELVDKDAAVGTARLELTAVMVLSWADHGLLKEPMTTEILRAASPKTQKSVE